MRLLRRTSQFKRDVKKAKLRGKDIEKLKSVILRLAKNEVLEARYRDHALVGPYRGTRECHLEPDWLLIYTLVGLEELVLIRTGTHSDLFKE